LSKLPPTAAAKMRRLKGEQDDINAAIFDLSQRRQPFIETRRLAEQNLEGFRNYRPTRGAHPHIDNPDRAIATAQREFDDAEAEIAMINERLGRLNARKSKLADNLFGYLRDRIPAGIVIEEHPAAPPPELAKGQTWATFVEAQRDRIASLRADLHEVRSACLPAAVVKAMIRKQIADLAARGRIDVLPSIEIGRAIVWPSTTTIARVAGPAGEALGPVATPDVLGLLAWLHGDKLVKLLEGEVDELADDSHALSDDDRSKRERELLSAILEAERIEVAAVEAADTSEIVMRPDTDPRAALNLSGDLPPPR
jgi:hypothetical protein